MVDYGRQRSTVKPEAIALDENSVWVYTDIQAVNEPMGEEGAFDGWEFDMKRYGKDEYITSLSKQLDDTQLALVEVYELIGGE